MSRRERECYYVNAIADGIRVEKLENGLKGVLLLEICIFYEPGLVKLCGELAAAHSDRSRLRSVSRFTETQE